MARIYRIGYIDEKEEQVGKFRRRLRDFGFEVIGYHIYEGLTLGGLMEQVYASDIELLLIDYKLNETGIITFNGEEVERAIYEQRPSFPHIIFTSKREDAESHVEDWKIIYEKELLDDENDPARFVTMLQKSIEQYEGHLQRKKDRLISLIEKGEGSGLDAIEKSEVVDLQSELIRLEGNQTVEVPLHLLKFGNLDALSETRREAEDLLKSLLNESEME